MQPAPPEGYHSNKLLFEGFLVYYICICICVYICVYMYMCIYVCVCVYMYIHYIAKSIGSPPSNEQV